MVRLPFSPTEILTNFAIMTHKGLKSTLFFCFAYLIALVASSCVDETDPDIWGPCPGPVDANLTDLEIYFSPYITESFATEDDTVSIENFRVNLNAEAEFVSEVKNSSFLPGNVYALSCAVAYNLLNVSQISIFLNEDFGTLSKDQNISDLFENYEEVALSDIKDFTKFYQYLELNYVGDAANYSQMNIRTVVFLKNGSQIVVNSVSPKLKTD